MQSSHAGGPRTCSTHISFHAGAQAAFDPAPSLDSSRQTKLIGRNGDSESATSVGVPVASDGEVPSELGLDRAALNAAGFEGNVGQTLIVRPARGPRSSRSASARDDWMRRGAGCCCGVRPRCGDHERRRDRPRRSTSASSQPSPSSRARCSRAIATSSKNTPTPKCCASDRGRLRREAG